uniref:Uncharacterized protein n=1 Tax=Oryza glaberrima TaxID=4538 RepID=I1NYT9_ORYGL
MPSRPRGARLQLVGSRAARLFAGVPPPAPPTRTLPPRALHRPRRPHHPPRHPGLRPPPPSPSVEPRAGGLRLPRLACRGVATSSC